MSRIKFPADRVAKSNMAAQYIISTRFTAVTLFSQFEYRHDPAQIYINKGEF